MSLSKTAHFAGYFAVGCQNLQRKRTSGPNGLPTSNALRSIRTRLTSRQRHPDGCGRLLPSASIPPTTSSIPSFVWGRSLHLRVQGIGRHFYESHRSGSFSPSRFRRHATVGFSGLHRVYGKRVPARRRRQPQIRKIEELFADWIRRRVARTLNALLRVFPILGCCGHMLPPYRRELTRSQPPAPGGVLKPVMQQQCALTRPGSNQAGHVFE